MGHRRFDRFETRMGFTGNNGESKFDD